MYIRLSAVECGWVGSFLPNRGHDSGHGNGRFLRLLATVGLDRGVELAFVDEVVVTQDATTFALAATEL